MAASQPQTDADDWHIAHFEVRFDGKHSSAEDAAHFVAHGTSAELDAMQDELQTAGRWARWTSETLLTPSDARGEYAWLFETGDEDEASEASQDPVEPTFDAERARAAIESKLKSNSDHAARTQKRHAAGHLSKDQAEGLMHYWAKERTELESERAELDAASPAE